MPEEQREFLQKVAREAAKEAPSGLEQKRAVDAVMGVLVDWQMIESDLDNVGPARR